METKEYSVLVCKHCGETKKRFLDGNFPNRKDKRWVNEEGKQWSGKVCAECVVEKSRLRQKNKRGQMKVLMAALEENK